MYRVLITSYLDMETSPSPTQTSFNTLESGVATAIHTGCESLQCGDVVSEQIEELDSKQSYLTTNKGVSLSGTLSHASLSIFDELTLSHIYEVYKLQ